MKDWFQKSVGSPVGNVFSKEFHPFLLPLLAFCLPLGLPAAPSRLFVPQESIETLAGHAEQLENVGKWDDAESIYREILKMDPRSIGALNRLGVIAVRRGQFDTGIRYYKQAFDLDPSEFGTNLNLGIAYIKRQDFGNAVPPLERAVQAEPGSFQAHELLAGALIGKNDFSLAVPHLEKARELNPTDIATLYLLERAYLETKQFEKALSAFENLESLDPGSPWVRILRGQAEDSLANYDKAIAEFEAARQQLPHDATVRFSLGFMYWKVRRLVNAESELRQALKLDRDFEEARYYLADTFILEQKPTEALPLLEALLRLHPKDGRALADQGKALEQLSRDAEAAHAYEACLRIEPERADVHYRLARIYRNLRRSEESAREFATARQLQLTKHEEQETLLQATGARGDPTRSKPGTQPDSNRKVQ
jgi:tetratricopeptide (TPR) repeat protein